MPLAIGLVALIQDVWKQKDDLINSEDSLQIGAGIVIMYAFVTKACVKSRRKKRTSNGNLIKKIR